MYFSLHKLIYHIEWCKSKYNCEWLGQTKGFILSIQILIIHKCEREIYNLRGKRWNSFISRAGRVVKWDNLISHQVNIFQPEEGEGTDLQRWSRYVRQSWHHFHTVFLFLFFRFCFVLFCFCFDYHLWYESFHLTLLAQHWAKIIHLGYFILKIKNFELFSLNLTQNIVHKP